MRKQQENFFLSIILSWKSRLHLVLSATLIFCLCACFLVNNSVVLAATLPEIQQRGYLTIAVKDNIRPLAFKDQKGNLQGLEIDLARKLAEDILGKADSVKLQPVVNSDRLPFVFNHIVDLAIADVTATESRSRVVSLSVPYYYDSTGIVTKNTSIKSLQDLKNQKIAVLNHSSSIGYVQYFIPQAELISVNSYGEAREKIDNQLVAALAADTSVITGWSQENREYRILPIKLSAQPLSVVMPKGLQYDDLRRKVNEAIARYTVIGWLKERYQHWGL
ncbi:transporter substrate-binding domain-containing protein [Anabaena sp. FACHB-1237]|uniref:transporter substrate-binding domain-containing protein n=1 Tax=Anabaena sp. FACHB-1237 TaxID=2692769 RepID=UPI0016805054|nr:transporter substrate-binding domain-containing protein [Anabaena sp. FACHB-1237]MBD2136474.1 transporter substrate-binding domain-containing protein [Anabaena sp. FACHB-1237]